MNNAILHSLKSKGPFASSSGFVASHVTFEPRPCAATFQHLDERRGARADRTRLRVDVDVQADAEAAALDLPFAAARKAT